MVIPQPGPKSAVAVLPLIAIKSVQPRRLDEAQYLRIFFNEGFNIF